MTGFALPPIIGARLHRPARLQRRPTRTTPIRATQRRIFRLPTIVACLAALPAVLAAQAPHHIIQGRVTTDSGVVIPAADVIVTIAPSAESIISKSDSTGAFRVVIDHPTGEYLLYVAALGRKPFRQRVTIPAGDTIATINPKLSAAVATIATVRVQARKPRPTSSLGGDDLRAGTDATDKRVDGVNGALSPDQQTNIDAMASLIPGLSVTAAGVSASGLGPDANAANLNGLAFGGGDLPRDLSTTTRFIASPWDPTRGGFSGVLSSRTVTPGGNISARHAHATLDAPQLQAADPVATQLGQRYTNLAFSEGGLGPIALDRWYYDYGFSVSRRTAPVSSLLNLDADALEHAGISPDSAQRLVQILQQQQVPLAGPSSSTARATTSATAVARFDHRLPTTPFGGVPSPLWWTTVFANFSQSSALALSPTSAPAFGGKTTAGAASLQSFYSRSFGDNGDYINESTASLNFNENRGTPYLALPSGTVTVLSTGTDGAETTGGLSFGGNSVLQSDNRLMDAEFVNQTDFLFRGNAAFPMKLYFQGKFDTFDQTIAANRLGSYGYASLADLAAGDPSVYSRTLNAPSRSGDEWRGATALGVNWVTRKLTVTGGARLDADAFPIVPAYNSTVDQLFGQRTDHAPTSIDVSPRLGFNWYYKAGGLNYSVNGLSTVYRGGPQIRGGIGEFRGDLAPTLLADAISSTGLPGGMQQLICTGPAAPIPDWQAFASGSASAPSTCVGGSSQFADTARAVTLFDRSYSAPRTWKATLGWTATLASNFVAIDGAYSWNLRQPGTVDLNFAGTPQFTLADEANRPVFVDLASIVASTGAVSSVDSRRSPDFGRVADRVSDLRGENRQITLYTIPNIPLNIGTFIVSYTYADAQSQARGFDQNSAGDPRTVEWARVGYVPRHQFQVQGARYFFGYKFGLTAAARIMSGLPFTPVVAGDINGDGSSFDDRAYIFKPAAAPDTIVGRGLAALMTSGSSTARACLARQVGQIAGRNSCVGPWSTALTMSAVYAPALPRTDNRAHLALSLSNPLSGLDQLLHGADHLHGWGTTPILDGTLYQVRGFDPSTREFQYSVNSRFGNTNPAATTLRTPFRVTLDLSIDLGRSYAEQSLEQSIRVQPHLVGTRAPADTLKDRFLKQNFEDIYGIVLRLSDSLALSRDQIQRVQSERAVLQAKADTVYGNLASYLAALPPSFDTRTAVRRSTEADSVMWEHIYDEGPFIKTLLTSGQIRLLPGPLFQLVTAPNRRARFFGF